MKTLIIPKIDGLDSMESGALRTALKAEGAHDVIANAPWADFPYRPEVRLNVAASDRYLYVDYAVKGLGLKAEFGATNKPVWQDSCVEFFAADPAGKGYRNFEINCIGTLLSAYQEGKGVNVRPISEEEASKVIRYTTLPRETFAEKEGEHEWRVTAAIPWSLMGFENAPEELRVNFYKCADGSRWPHYLCWAPIDTPEPDFHRPEFFGILKIADSKQ